MENLFSRSVANNLKSLPELFGALNRFLDTHELSVKAVNAVNLVLEEAVVNVINHGFPAGEAHAIDVQVEVGADDVRVQLADDGLAFNPLTTPRPDKSKPARERIEDGLGLHLMRNIMRSMSYRRKGDKNIFEIWISRTVG